MKESTNKIPEQSSSNTITDKIASYTSNFGNFIGDFLFSSSKNEVKELVNIIPGISPTNISNLSQMFPKKKFAISDEEEELNGEEIKEKVSNPKIQEEDNNNLNIKVEKIPKFPKVY